MSLEEQIGNAPRIRLVARDEARNIRRGYTIERSTDLFGHTVVDWSWGRLGTRGQSRRRAFACPEEAARFVRALLRRRGTAEKRIGVAYRPAMVQLSERGPQSAPARKKPSAPGLTRDAVPPELGYRLMRFALGIGTKTNGMIEIVPWGRCSPEVTAILVQAGQNSQGRAGIWLTVDDAVLLAERLEAEAPPAVFKVYGAQKAYARVSR